ncbi:MAG: cell filamentation protein Fic [Firmicutes bacterium]|nr:cell filamentation protein Fic [Bacillota bacterium]
MTDDYFVEDEEIIQNKLGIKDPKILHRFEEEITFIRIAEIEDKPVVGSFDFDHLKEIHKRIFSDIYDFAGKARTVNLLKNSSVFCYSENIESEQKSIFTKLAKNNYLKSLPKDEFIRKFAELAGDLNALHPFREGNGRAIRVFLSQLGRNADYDIRYRDADIKELLEADIAAFHCDFKPMIELLNKITFPLKSEW